MAIFRATIRPDVLLMQKIFHSTLIETQKSMNNNEIVVARALLDMDAVGFKLDDPITFKSGIKSPVYVDNRKLPFHPPQWTRVIESFGDLLSSDSIHYDIIAGVETAGIPHSAALGFFLDKPSVFVRKHAKDHGTKKMVEGGSVTGRKVVLIEDLVTTGGSSLDGIESLRAEGANVDSCAVIVSYGFAEANEAFEKAGVTLHSLTSFPVILKEAYSMGKIDEAGVAVVTDWLGDPHSWAARRRLA